MYVDFPVPFAHAAVLCRDGQILCQQGDLYAEFPLMSVTKPLAAYAILLAVQGGKLALDVPAEPEAPGATLAHLLSHAAGLDYEGGQICAPETKRIYSNRGIELAAELTEQATVLPFGEFAQKTVFEPLGLVATQISGSPAWSGISTVADLVKVAAELSSPTLLSAELYRQFRHPIFPELRGILPGYGMQNPCEFGLGVEVRGQKTPHWTTPQLPPETIGHFGISGSYVFAVPREADSPLAGVGGAFLGGEKFGSWHLENWPLLQEHLLANSEAL